MAISDDFSLDYSTKEISYIGGGTRYHANELYSWLQDLFDDLGQMDDDPAMSAQTPTAYSLINGWQMADATVYQYLYGGAITDTTNDDLWANLYTLGTIESGTTLFVLQDGALLTGFWPAGHIDILVKVSSGGVGIDSGVVTVFARELGDLYDFFSVDLSGGGRNAVPIATSLDGNNLTAEGTIATYSDVSLSFGSVSKDLNNGNGAKDYDVVVDCAGRSLSQVYEYLKYLTRRSSVINLGGVPGQFYEYADPSYSAVKQAPFGTFAGGTLFGARGVWLENMAANQKYQLIAADGSQQIPPNYVYVEVNALQAGDRVAVFVLDGVGGDIETSQYAVQSVTSNTVVVGSALASDTPQSGYLRLGSVETAFTYTGWNGSTFTGVSPDPQAAGVQAADAIMVPIIDAVAAGASVNNSLIYDADIPVLVRVRKYGILPFQIEGLITSSGFSQAAIRTPDTIVS